MHVQPHIVWQLLEIRDRELRERAARRAAVTTATPAEPAAQRRAAAAKPGVASATC